MPEGSLAYRLRVARLEKGLTLREAAKVTGVDKATISAVERNKRTPFDVTLSRLAKGYGVSISQLVEEPIGEEPGPPQDSATRPTPTLERYSRTARSRHLPEPRSSSACGRRAHRRRYSCRQASS